MTQRGRERILPGNSTFYEASMKPVCTRQGLAGRQHIKQQGCTRRAFIQRGGVAAAASALAAVSPPWVHAGEDNTIRLGLIGCGGRGSGAVSDAFDSRFGPVKLFAMADLFENRLESALQVLKGRMRRSAWMSLRSGGTSDLMLTAR